MTYTFDPNHPPRLKDFGFGAISAMNPSATSTPESHRARTPAAAAFFPRRADITDLDPPVLVPVIVTFVKYWVQSLPPQQIAMDMTLKNTTVYSTTEVDTESMNAAISATVGVEPNTFNPVKADLTASLGASSTMEKSATTGSTTEHEVNLKAGNTYAFWELVTEISITADGVCMGAVLIRGTKDGKEQLLPWAGAARQGTVLRRATAVGGSFQDACDSNLPPPSGLTVEGPRGV